MRRNAFRLAFAAAAVAALAALPARAFFGADEAKIYSPAVEKGELEIEHFAVGTNEKEESHALAVGYGFTDWLMVEAYSAYHRDASDASNPSPKLTAEAVELESRIRLTQPGRYWADFGLLAEFEFPHEDEEAHAFKISPLIEKQFGNALFTANIPIEWKLGGEEPVGESGAILGTKFRGQYLLSPVFSPGFEYFGEEGPINALPSAKEQTHAAGPGIFGRFKLGSHALKYRAVSLFGLTPATPDWALATQLELEL